MTHMNSLKRKALASSGAALLVVVLLLAGCGDKPEKLVASAQGHMDRQDYKSAIIELKNALKAKPDYAEARYLLGVSLFKVNDLVSAEKELRKAQELNYPAERAAPALGDVLLSEGKASELVSEFSATKLSEPQAHAQLSVQLGNAQLALGQRDRAQESFTSALESQPDSAGARVGQARVLAMRGKLQEAERVVDEVLAATPHQVDAISLKSNLAFAQGRPDEGLEQLRQLVQLTPDSIDNRFSLAVALLRRGNRDAEVAQQIDAMKKIAARDPRTLYLQSALELNKGNWTAARDHALNVLKTQPSFLPALAVAGAASLQLRSYNQAQEHLHKALELAPKQLLIRKLLAVAYTRGGDINRASRTIEDGLKQAPDDGALLSLAGEVALAKGDLDAAAEYYERAVKTGNAGVNNRLAQVRFAEGRTDEALQILEANSAATETQVQSDLVLAVYYARRGEPEKALPWIEKVEKKQPNNPRGPMLRGVLSATKKDYAEARRYFERALELRGDFAPALEALTALDVLDRKPEVAQQRFEATLAKYPKAEAVALSYVKFLRSQSASTTKVVEILQGAIRSEPMAMNARTALIQTYLGMNDTAKALTAAQEAVAAAPDDPRILEIMGETQLAAKQYNQAIATFEKVATLRPQSAQPLLMLAAAHQSSGDQQKTLNALEKALHIEPTFLAAQLALINMQLAAGKPDEALAVAREIQKQKPREPIGYLREADILQATKHSKESLTVLERGFKATSSPGIVAALHLGLTKVGRQSDADQLAKNWLKDNPKDVVVRSYLADRALKTKDYELAARLYKTILSIQPNMPVALNNMAWVGEQLKDPQALEYAKQANLLRPNTPRIMDTLGWILVERGSVDEGVAVLQKAVELTPAVLPIRVDLAKALIRAGRKDEAKRELDYLAKNAQGPEAQAEVAALMQELNHSP